MLIYQYCYFLACATAHWVIYWPPDKVHYGIHTAIDYFHISHNALWLDANIPVYFYFLACAIAHRVIYWPPDKVHYGIHTAIDHLHKSHNACWLDANIPVLLPSSLCNYSESYIGLRTRQGALWDMHKRSILKWLSFCFFQFAVAFLSFYIFDPHKEYM